MEKILQNISVTTKLNELFITFFIHKQTVCIMNWIVNEILQVKENASRVCYIYILLTFLDTQSLSNSHLSHKCKRTQDVMNVYADVLDTINFLVDKNNGVKESYQNFLKGYTERFADLEQKVLHSCKLLILLLISIKHIHNQFS